MKQESANLIKNKSRLWIQKALFELMNTTDYNKINVTMICEKADLTRQTFYRLYSSKEDIMHQYMINIFNDCYKLLESQSNPTLENLLITYFTFWREHKELVDFLYKHKLQSHTLNGNLRLVDRLEELSNQSFSPIYKRILAGAIYSCIDSWMRTGMKENEKEIVEEMLSIIKK